jgi:transcriptional regulator with XRE-family HTH domain
MIKRVAEFKDRLNEALSIRNIKPVELAEKLGVTEGTISQYRKGTTKAKSDRLYEIAQVLDVDPVWLMGVDVPMTKKDRIQDLIKYYVSPTMEEIEEDEMARRIEKALDLYDLYESATPDNRLIVDLALKQTPHKS